MRFLIVPGSDSAIAVMYSIMLTEYIYTFLSQSLMKTIMLPKGSTYKKKWHVDLPSQLHLFQAVILL